MFAGYLMEDIATTEATIRTLRAGSGPPLLLLHGYPQTHVIWHKIAGRLAETFSVVVTDLRGYGDSSKPDEGDRHQNYSFRAMAQDQLEVMRHLGYERFFVGSHDRGARTLTGCVSITQMQSEEFALWILCLPCACIGTRLWNSLPSICGGSS